MQLNEYYLLGYIYKRCSSRVEDCGWLDGDGLFLGDDDDLLR